MSILINHYIKYLKKNIYKPISNLSKRLSDTSDEISTLDLNLNRQGSEPSNDLKISVRKIN